VWAQLGLYLQYNFQLLSSNLCNKQKLFMKLQQQFINSHMINSGLCLVQENSEETSPQSISLLIRSYKGPQKCFSAWQISADRYPPTQAGPQRISLSFFPAPGLVPGLVWDMGQAGKPASHGREVLVTMDTQGAPGCLQSIPVPQNWRGHLHPGPPEEHQAHPALGSS